MNAHRVASRTPEHSPGRGTRRLAPFPGRARRARFRATVPEPGSGLRELVPAPPPTPRTAIGARRSWLRSRTATSDSASVEAPDAMSSNARSGAIPGIAPGRRARTTLVGYLSGRPGPKNNGTPIRCTDIGAAQGRAPPRRFVRDSYCYRAQ